MEGASIMYGFSEASTYLGVTLRSTLYGNLEVLKLGPENAMASREQTLIHYRDKDDKER